MIHMHFAGIFICQQFHISGGALTLSSAMPDRYYDQFSEYVYSLNSDGQFLLDAVPEPGSALIAANLLVLGFIAHRWRLRNGGRRREIV